MGQTLTILRAAALGEFVAQRNGENDCVMASSWGAPTASQKEVFDAMGFAWKAGFGAIVGLLGGKVT
jgi:hypothetical protein